MNKLRLLLTKYREKMRKEGQCFGTACDDETGIERALSEIIEREQQLIYKGTSIQISY